MGVVKKKLRIFPLIEPDLTIPVDKARKVESAKPGIFLTKFTEHTKQYRIQRMIAFYTIIH